MSYGKFDRDVEVKSLKRVAFLGVSIATIATLGCAVAVPMLYNYLQRMQSSMQNEVEFCKSRSGNIWKEVTRTQVLLQNLLKSFENQVGGQKLESNLANNLEQWMNIYFFQEIHKPHLPTFQTKTYEKNCNEW